MQFHDAFSPGAHLSESFEALKRQPASLIVGFLLVGLVSNGPNAVGRGMGQGVQAGGDDVNLALVATLTLVFFAVMLLGWFAQCWLVPGWLRVQVRALDPEGTEEVSDLFSGGDCFGRMLGWTTLYGTILLGTVLVALLFGVAAGGAVALAMGGSLGNVEASGFAAIAVGLGVTVLVGFPALLYVSLGMTLGTHALVLENLSPMDALSRSWDLVAGHRTTLFVYLLVQGMVNTLGLLACCVGAIPAGIVTSLAMTRSWLLLTQGAQAKV